MRHKNVSIPSQRKSTFSIFKVRRKAYDQQQSSFFFFIFAATCEKLRYWTVSVVCLVTGLLGWQRVEGLL